MIPGCRYIQDLRHWWRTWSTGKVPIKKKHPTACKYMPHPLRHKNYMGVSLNVCYRCRKQVIKVILRVSNELVLIRKKDCSKILHSLRHSGRVSFQPYTSHNMSHIVWCHFRPNCHWKPEIKGTLSWWFAQTSRQLRRLLLTSSALTVFLPGAPLAGTTLTGTSVQFPGFVAEAP